MIDTASLLIHVLSAAGMVGGGLVQVLGGTRLRGATTTTGLREWAAFVRLGGFVVLGSAVGSFLTGGHLAGAVWTTESTSGFSYPFVTLGAVALVLLAPVGPMVGGAGLRRIAASLPETDRALDADARAAASAARIWGPVHSLVGVAVGLIGVMVTKPGWAATAIVLLGTFAVGWATGVVAARPSSPSHAAA